MDIPRSTMAIIIHEWIQQREKVEKSWGYTMDSGILAAARSMLNEARSTEGTLELCGDPI